MKSNLPGVHAGAVDFKSRKNTTKNSTNPFISPKNSGVLKDVAKRFKN